MVKRYLKLTNVSPRIFALCAEGKGDAPKPVHPKKLNRMLTAHRTAAIQAAMASQPEVALAALVHQLVLKVFSIGYAETPVKINMEQAYLKTDAENVEQSRAAIALAEKRRYWKERIETAEQGGRTLFRWAAGTAAARPSGVTGPLHRDFNQYGIRSGECSIG